MDEAGVEDRHHGDDDRRHAHQQGHGQAALRGVDADLALNLESFADDVRQVVENFGKIASSLALQHNGSNEELDVDQRNTLCQIHQSVTNRHAELLLFIELAELTGDRLGDLVGDHFQRGGESMSGTNRASESVDSLGKEFLKLFETLGAADGSVGVRKEKSDEQRNPGHFNAFAGCICDAGGGDTSHGRQSQEIAGADIDSTLRQQLLQVVDALRSAKQGVDRGNIAKLLVAQ